jgi:hypothetical protein
MAITKATASSIAPAAKGNLVVGSATNDAAVLGVGANGTILTADSAEATGVKWAAAAGGGANWSLLNAGGTALTGASTITISGISNADKLMVIVANASSASASSIIGIRLNGDSASNYNNFGQRLTGIDPYTKELITRSAILADQRIRLFDISTAATSDGAGYVLISGCNSSGPKIFNSAGSAVASTGDYQSSYVLGGWYNSASVISSVSVHSSSGNFDNGTVYVYTSA